MNPTTPAPTSFFGVIDAISGGLTDQLALISTKLAGNALSLDILMIMLAAEIVIVLIMAMTGSGASAVQRGVEAMLYAAFIAGLTSSTAWTSTILPMSVSFPNDIITALGVSSDPTALKGDVAAQFGGIISNLMNPANIQPSARMNIAK